MIRSPGRASPRFWAILTAIVIGFSVPAFFLVAGANEDTAVAKEAESAARLRGSLLGLVEALIVEQGTARLHAGGAPDSDSIYKEARDNTDERLVAVRQVFLDSEDVPSELVERFDLVAATAESSLQEARQRILSGKAPPEQFDRYFKTLGRDLTDLGRATVQFAPDAKSARDAAAVLALFSVLDASGSELTLVTSALTADAPLNAVQKELLTKSQGAQNKGFELFNGLASIEARRELEQASVSRAFVDVARDVEILSARNTASDINPQRWLDAATDRVATLTAVGQRLNDESLTAANSASDSATSVRNLTLLGGLVLILVAVGVTWAVAGESQDRRVAQDRLEETARLLEQTKRLQRQLVAREKLASLGELTAGVAHELKNPLNLILNYSLLIEKDAERLPELSGATQTETLEDLQSAAARVRDHGQRANAIIDAMLRHSRKETAVAVKVNLTKLVDGYVDIAAAAEAATRPNFQVLIDREYADDPVEADANAGEIGQVIVNLLANAFDALHEQSETDPDFVPRLTISTAQTAQSAVITIQDNGPGIDSADQDKIFEPFYTTKPPGDGTGLGLSISSNILQAHDGELQVDSVLGEGAAFRIVIPVAPQD